MKSRSGLSGIRANKSGFNIFRAIAACFLTALLISQTVQASSVTLASTLRSNPDLSLFTKAMDIAHFWERLESEKSVTLFVPTDRAMVAEGSDFLMQSVLMTADNRGRLEELISAHVTRVLLPAESDIGDKLLRTFSGDCLLISRIGDAVRVGPEAVVLSSIQIGKHHLLTVDRLLVPDYQPSSECAKIPPMVGSAGG